MIQPDLECFLGCDSEISFFVTKRLLLRAGKVFLGLDTTVSSRDVHCAEAQGSSVN